MGAFDIRKVDRNMGYSDGVNEGIQWMDPMEPPFVISGFPWLKRDGVYRRLPVSPAEKLPESVDMLANHTAGGQIRFRSDSSRIMVKVGLKGPADMCHMPATGQCGFDCYVEYAGKYRYAGTTKYPVKNTEYTCEICKMKEIKMQSYVLNFPLYQGVERVLVGIDIDAGVAVPDAYKKPGKVVFYGTSITQGGCASRPGMAFTNIISRKLGIECINLGFSGSGKGEPEVAHVISGIDDPACYVLDYHGNCNPKNIMYDTLENFIGILRAKHKAVPILVVSKIRYPSENFDSESLLVRRELSDFQRKVIEDLRSKGDMNIYFFDGEEMLGPDFDECTVDGSHPTDLGFIRIADSLSEVLAEII